MIFAVENKDFKKCPDIKGTAEKRFVLLTEYLKEHRFITRKEYSALTGLLKDKASKELHQWYNEKKIERDGKVPHVIYTAIETKEE